MWYQKKHDNRNSLKSTIVHLWPAFIQQEVLKGFHSSPAAKLPRNIQRICIYYCVSFPKKRSEYPWLVDVSYSLCHTRFLCPMPPSTELFEKQKNLPFLQNCIVGLYKVRPKYLLSPVVTLELLKTYLKSSANVFQRFVFKMAQSDSEKCSQHRVDGTWKGCWVLYLGEQW